MGGALQGIRVIEIASYVTGPFAALLLADLGAEVIKIEQPGQGDPFRGWGENLYSSNFRSLNRNGRMGDRIGKCAGNRSLKGLDKEWVVVNDQDVF